MQNAVNNNISTNIKLSRVQIPKAIQSGVYFDSWLGNLGKKQ